MPLIFAGLLRLPFGTRSHHNNDLIGLSLIQNVVSFSLIVSPLIGMNIVWHSTARLSVIQITLTISTAYQWHNILLYGQTDVLRLRIIIKNN